MSENKESGRLAGVMDDLTDEQISELSTLIAREKQIPPEQLPIIGMLIHCAIQYRADALAYRTYLAKNPLRALEAAKFSSVPGVEVVDKRGENRGFVVSLIGFGRSTISGGRTFKRDEAERIAKWIRDYARHCIEYHGTSRAGFSLNLSDHEWNVMKASLAVMGGVPVRLSGYENEDDARDLLVRLEKIEAERQAKKNEQKSDRANRAKTKRKGRAKR